MDEHVHFFHIHIAIIIGKKDQSDKKKKKKEIILDYSPHRFLLFVRSYCELISI